MKKNSPSLGDRSSLLEFSKELKKSLRGKELTGVLEGTSKTTAHNSNAMKE